MVGKRPRYQTIAPRQSTFSQLMNVDRLHGLLEFGADPFVLRKTIFFGLGVVAKRRHHQRTGPLPSTFSQLLRFDRLHRLLEFGADPFSTKKI